MLKEKWKRAWAWINQVEDYTPEVFVKSQWQLGETSTLYLLYRWMLAGVYVCGLTASILDLGREPPKHTPKSIHFIKWFIYLTNWGFSICTLQSIMSTIHVTKHYVNMRHNPNTVSGMEKMKTSYKIYWILHSISVISAIVITSVYWTSVYNPEKDKLDAVNLIVHLFNSLLMIIDLWIVAHPLKLLHCYWVFCFASVYIMFNYVYFLAGGTDRLGRTYIYRILDWRMPVNALIAVVAALVYEVLVTVVLWMMCIVRRRLANCFHRKIAARCTQDKNEGPRIV